MYIDIFLNYIDSLRIRSINQLGKLTESSPGSLSSGMGTSTRGPSLSAIGHLLGVIHPGETNSHPHIRTEICARKSGPEVFQRSASQMPFPSRTSA